MLENKVVLIVEDEVMIAALLEDFLSDLGCLPVGPAYSLAAARTLLDEQPCDAAIVDLNLAGVHAKPLIEQLLAAGRPVVVATGYGASAQDVPPGCTMLGKPYTLHHIEAALRSCFNA